MSKVRKPVSNDNHVKSPIKKQVRMEYYKVELNRSREMNNIQEEEVEDKTQNNEADSKDTLDFGYCGYFLIGLAYVLFFITLPLSLCASLKVK
jgi:hypothetical protein